MTKKKTKARRPRKVVQRTEYPRVTALAAQGHSIATIAKHLGMEGRTLKRRMAEDPRLKDAFDAGRAVEEETIVNSMLEQAADTSNPRSVQAGKFLLTTRHGYKDGEPSSQVNVQNNTLKISFPKTVAAKDLSKHAAALLEGTAQEVKRDD